MDPGPVHPWKSRDWLREESTTVCGPNQDMHQSNPPSDRDTKLKRFPSFGRTKRERERFL